MHGSASPTNPAPARQPPEPPPVPGLVVRRFLGKPDFEHVVAIHEGRRTWDRVDPLSTTEGIPSRDDVARRFAGRSDLDAAHVVRGVEVAGQVVGLGRVW
jgi:hypothetical protein